MKSWIGPLLERHEHFIHQTCVGPAGQGVLLGPAHFGRRDHLHRFGDLRRVADRFDAASYDLRVSHQFDARIRVSILAIFRLETIIESRLRHEIIARLF
jgi:hypothetical protein